MAYKLKSKIEDNVFNKLIDCFCFIWHSKIVDIAKVTAGWGALLCLIALIITCEPLFCFGLGMAAVFIALLMIAVFGIMVIGVIELLLNLCKYTETVFLSKNIIF